MKRIIGIILLLVFNVGPVFADLTLQGPAGFINVPSAQTIKYKQIEWAARSRMFRVPGTGSERYLTNLSLGFSPIRDFEIGVQKAVDSRRGADDFDPDPTINFKARIPPIGSGDFADTALGMVLDTNPNNYHSLYLALGGVSVGWNFGGNPGSGIANFGTYDRGRQAPKPLFFMFGGDLTPGLAGERGYRTHYFFDYNGDIFSAACRLKSHRGFWIDAAWHGKGTYDFQYDFLPLSIAVGAIF